MINSSHFVSSFIHCHSFLEIFPLCWILAVSYNIYVLKREHRLQQGTAFENDPWSQAVCGATTFAEALFNKDQIFINTMSSAVAQHEVPAISQIWYEQLD